MEKQLIDAAHKLAAEFATNAAINFATSEAMSAEAEGQLRNALGKIADGKLTIGFEDYELVRVAFIGAYRTETSKTVDAANMAFSRLFEKAYGFKANTAKPKAEGDAATKAAKRSEIEEKALPVASGTASTEDLEEAARKAIEAAAKAKAAVIGKKQTAEIKADVKEKTEAANVAKKAFELRKKAEGKNEVETIKRYVELIREKTKLAVEAGDVALLKAMAEV